jgi:HAE1 family hydrophobic/amphiphilic exporter-1
MFEKMKTLPGFSQLYSDLEVKQPQVYLHILRDRASVLNVTTESIENALGYAYAYQNLSPINTPNNQYYVILEVLPKFYRDPPQLSQLYVTSTTGKLVPLSQVTEVVETLGPLSVNHLNGFPSVTISFNLVDIPLSKALAELDQLANDTLPPTVKGEVQGTASAFKESFASLTALLLVTIFLLYVILGILYENFFHPLTVMSTLPLAAVGGLLTLYIFGQTLSLYSFVGFIMLLGIVMKNGIILVDFANEAINEGKNIHDAIKSACLVRFRPILMTTLAALMGAVPIALGIGGMTALSRRSLGLVIVGGLLISQVLTLFLTPVAFIYLELLREKIQTWKKKRLKDVDEKREKPEPDELG